MVSLLAWAPMECIRLGSTSSMGATSGLISGLVATTPACGAVSPLGALAIGLIAGSVCSLAIELKFRMGFDVLLDVVGVHLVGGVLGTLLVDLFATTLLTGSKWPLLGWKPGTPRGSRRWP